MLRRLFFITIVEPLLTNFDEGGLSRIVQFVTRQALSNTHSACALTLGRLWTLHLVCRYLQACRSQTTRHFVLGWKIWLGFCNSNFCRDKTHSWSRFGCSCRAQAQGAPPPTPPAAYGTWTTPVHGCKFDRQTRFKYAKDFTRPPPSRTMFL